MYYNVVEVRYLEGYTLEISFANGKKGIVDFADYIQRGGVFSRFANLDYFKQAYVDEEIGVLCWPEGLDIAPETLYSKATGEPLPAWTRPEEKSVKGAIGVESA
jgi:hypothetical protein